MHNFSLRVYELLSTVPKGRVTTYKELAKALNTKAYRAIGTILSHNPYAPRVPCHRVVTSNGEIGGFMGKREGETIEKKKNLLASEGVVCEGNRIVNFQSIVYSFSDPR